MFFQRTKKKICALILASTLGLTCALPIPTAEAISVGDIVGIGATYAIQKKQVDAACKQLNYTDEGRRELYNSFRKNYGVNSNSAVNAKLDRIMKNLSSAVAKVDPTIDERPYLYFVSNDESINAACGMGHVMMVNIGTFNNISNEDEIAAIVGHEMGHGQKDHVYTSIKKRQTKTLIASLGVAAAGGGILTQLAGSIALMNVNAHSDKKHETEADALSLEYMVRTGYNPGACAAVMQRFVDVFGKSKKSSILNPSDHPDSELRRDRAAKYLYTYSGKIANAADGVVTIHGKTFCAPVATSDMSGAERSYFVLGNLARAFHDGQGSASATVQNGTVYLGSQEIFTPATGDESAETLADRLNSLKNSK